MTQSTRDSNKLCVCVCVSPCRLTKRLQALVPETVSCINVGLTWGKSRGETQAQEAPSANDC